MKASHVVFTIMLVYFCARAYGESDILTASPSTLSITEVMACDLPPEIGPCDGAFSRYYYNTNSGTCEQFIYGGCNGNANNYMSFNLCIAACGDVCQLEPEVGPCDASIPRYYYNTNSGTCEQFIYGGCNGNANNYASFNLCIAACGDACQLEPDVGPCDAALSRWYFNSSSGHCEQFVYGGCGGNQNRYLTRAMCMAACGDVCYLPPDPGPCQAAIPRFYFDPTTGHCQQFNYGGCGGNANNYSSYTVCMNACAAPCDMPAVRGPCLAAIPRYFYNRVTEQCELFIYGGCGGNDNNYLTLMACQAACPCPSSIQDDNLYTLNMNAAIDASGYITSTSIVSDSSRLVYSANDYINLLPGFSVEKDSRLHIILEGCRDN